MIVLPHAKINLGLRVLRLRPDGYRDIRTLMIPVPLNDMLEAVEAPDLRPGEVQLTHSGLPVPGDPANDLCIKAVSALAERTPLPGLRMHLHKAIPTGAGLGGGSSDAAHTLLLLNELLGLGLGPQDLHAIAAGLGSDCAFFLDPRPQLAEGRGEVLRAVPLELTGWWLVLANPGVHVPTPEVYAHTPAQDRDEDLLAVVQEPPDQWMGRVVNDMEQYVFNAYPQVGNLKQALLDAGASYAAMSGSGATVFGLFHHQPRLEHLGPQVLLNTRLGQLRA